MKPRIYMAGKITDIADKHIQNVHEMIKSGEEVRKEGFSVYVPALIEFMGAVCGGWKYNDYFDNSQPWLDVSDAVYVRGKNWRESDGTIREIKRARKNKIPMFFEELNGLTQMKKYFFGKKDYVNPFMINKPKDLEEVLSK